jgi:hypothetical protein
MYSFRYHLATICSVFLALAVGLLLGASIASSEIFKDTTSNAIQSLREEFDGIMTANQTLKTELKQTENLTSDLLGAWSTNQLKGDRVLLVKNASPEQASEVSILSTILQTAGAEVVVMTTNDSTFGLQDSALTAKLKMLLPEVSGEDYSKTLARALVNEWATSPETASSTLASASALSSGDAAAAAAKTAAVQSHPLTDLLVSSGIVTFSNSQVTNGTAVIPQKITGFLDICISTTTSAEGGSAATNPVPFALSLASACKNVGVVTVLTQTSSLSQALLDAAYASSVSGVSDMTTPIGQYSIVALFAGATSGVYGSSAAGSLAYPAIPTTVVATS